MDMTQQACLNRRLSILSSHVNPHSTQQQQLQQQLEERHMIHSHACSAENTTDNSALLEEAIESDLYDQSLESEKQANKEINIVISKDKQTNDYLIEPIEDELSFDQGFFYAVRAIQELKRVRAQDKNNTSCGNVIVVGIAGPAGAGKTFLAKKLSSVVHGLVISMERFVRVEQAIDQNFEDVSLVDFETLKNLIGRFKKGETPLTVPKISFQKRKVLGQHTVHMPTGRVIFLDGLYALHKNIRSMLDLTISVSGGVHLDLLNRVMREITPKRNTIEKITSIVFPMYKAFIEQDMRSAKIRITGNYNPMNTIADPLYVCRAKYSDVHVEIENFLKQQLQTDSSTQSTESRTKKFKDIYLYPPKYDPSSSSRSDRQKWIRIRNSNGQFYIYFYNEMMNSVVNIRPQLYFEISVKTLGGLLSLGYQIGAVIDRETTVIYDKDAVQITIEKIMGGDYVQIKGKDRNKVIKFAEELKMSEHHIPQSFLYLHFRDLALKKKNARQERSYPVDEAR